MLFRSVLTQIYFWLGDAHELDESRRQGVYLSDQMLGEDTEMDDHERLSYNMHSSLCVSLSPSFALSSIKGVVPPTRALASYAG